MNYVYFIADLEKDVVKIGVSKNPKSRLKQLQTSNSNRLALLGYIYGEKAEEQYLHCLFGKYKLSGEWFILNDEIIDYLNSVNLMDCFVDRIDGKVYILKKMKNF
jgi:hypothetical protein